MSYVPRKIAKVAKMLPIQLPNRGLHSDGIPAIKTSLGLGKLWLVWRVGFWDAKWGRGSSQRVHLRHDQGFFRWNFARIRTLFVIEHNSGTYPIYLPFWCLSNMRISYCHVWLPEGTLCTSSYLKHWNSCVRRSKLNSCGEVMASLHKAPYRYTQSQHPFHQLGRIAARRGGSRWGIGFLFLLRWYLQGNSNFYVITKADVDSFS